MVALRLVYEDLVSLAVMERLIQLHTDTLTITARMPAGGFGNIKKNIGKYNRAARSIPFFILTDLDTGECAPALLESWLPQERAPHLLFRVAVREVESWILADREGFAAFLGVSVSNFRAFPDSLPDPKLELFRLTRKSRSRELKTDILPQAMASVGPGYNSAITRFVRESWSAESARRRSPSLDRAMKALLTFAEQR